MQSADTLQSELGTYNNTVHALRAWARHDQNDLEKVPTSENPISHIPPLHVY